MGEVAGFFTFSTPSGFAVRAFLWQNGQITFIKGAGQSEYAIAINQKGQVAGYSTDFGEHAFVWQNGRATALGGGEANDINDMGRWSATYREAGAGTVLCGRTERSLC